MGKEVDNQHVRCLLCDGVSGEDCERKNHSAMVKYMCYSRREAGLFKECEICTRRFKCITNRDVISRLEGEIRS